MKHSSASYTSVPEMRNIPRLMVLVLVIVLTGSSLLYLVSFTPDRFGYYHDDSIYVVTAKALATGRGYRIISLPYEPAQTKYPPFYPFLLSLIWLVKPKFPDNLFPMTLLSVLAAVAFLALVWSYLVKKGYATGWQALLVVTLTAINWRTAILATGIYSEMFYAALSAAGLWLAEEYEKERRGWATSIGLGVVMGLAFLTRTSGISLMIAVVLCYLIRRQLRKASLIFTFGSLFVLAWVGWCYANRTTLENINTAYYTSYYRLFIETVSDLPTLMSVIGVNTFMLILTSVPFAVLGLDYIPAQKFVLGSLAVIIATFSFITAGFLRNILEGVRPLHLYLLSYLSLHLLWPYMAYDRSLMPILPFILLFLVTELKLLLFLAQKGLTLSAQAIHKLSSAFVALIVIVLGGVALYNYSLGIHQLLTSKKVHAGYAAEDAEAIKWINANTAPSDVLLCYRDPLYYLFTGRKAIRAFEIIKPVPAVEDQSALYEWAKVIFQIIKETQSRFLIQTSSDFERESNSDPLQKSLKALIEKYPQIFVPIFESADGGTTIYRIEVGPLIDVN